MIHYYCFLFELEERLLSKRRVGSVSQRIMNTFGTWYLHSGQPSAQSQVSTRFTAMSNNRSTNSKALVLIPDPHVPPFAS